MRRVLLNFFIINFSLLMLIGCAGYKPSSHYVKKEIGDKVFVDLNININNALNSVVIKDAMNEMLVNRFGSSLVDTKDKANTIISISLGSVSLGAIQYNPQGYISIYRANVSLNVRYKANGFTRNLTVSDYYDFAVDPNNATISDTAKEEAIKQASSKALEEILSKIAIQTFK